MHEHAWDVSIAEAKEIQIELRKNIRLEPLKSKPKTIAGATFRRGEIRA